MNVQCAQFLGYISLKKLGTIIRIIDFKLIFN